MAPVKLVDKTNKICTKRGGGQGGEIALEDLQDGFKNRVEGGEGLVVANVELRMKRLPHPSCLLKTIQDIQNYVSWPGWTVMEEYDTKGTPCC